MNDIQQRIVTALVRCGLDKDDYTDFDIREIAWVITAELFPWLYVGDTSEEKPWRPGFGGEIESPWKSP